MRQRRKKEIILWGIIIVVFAACWIGMHLFQKKGNVVVVSVKDQIVQTMPLDKDKVIQIEGENGGWVKLQIKGGEADVVEASCPDQICVNHYAIAKEGEPIVCLPAKIIIQVEEEKGRENESK